MCTKRLQLQLIGTKTTYRGSAPGPYWGTPFPQTPCYVFPTVETDRYLWSYFDHFVA